MELSGVSPAKAFASLEQCACSFEPLALLVGLTQRHMFVRANDFHDEGSEVHREARRIELLAGILLSRQRAALGSKVPTSNDFKVVSELAEGYLMSLSQEMIREAINEPHSTLGDLVTDARNHSLNVRGDAYPHQFYDFARGLYGPHDAWFRDNLGFTIAEGISIAQAFFSKCKERNQASRQRADDEFAKRIGMAPPDATEDFVEALAEDITEEFHYRRAIENLGLCAEELAEASRVPSLACQRFLDRMSQEFGYRHPEYSDAFTNPLRTGWDFSTLCERPFLRDSGRYYMVLPTLVATAIYTTFYFDVLRDPQYVSTFNRAKGAWLESEIPLYFSGGSFLLIR